MPGEMSGYYASFLVHSGTAELQNGTTTLTTVAALSYVCFIMELPLFRAALLSSELRMLNFISAIPHNMVSFYGLIFFSYYGLYLAAAARVLPLF
eukprot:SAG11_NODE_5675_length_1489_cov_2.040288_3_plen_94_part_01